MIIEYLRQEWQTEAYFYCTLCEAKFQQVNFMPHVTGYRHRYGYIVSSFHHYRESGVSGRGAK